MREGIDYAWHGPLDPKVWVADGISFVCRYFSSTAGKNLTKAEAVQLSRAGLDIVIVWERTAQEYRGGFSAGRGAAILAEHMRGQVLMPSDKPIYYAIDWDCTAHDCALYFDGINSVVGPDLIGVYGSYQVVKGIMEAGAARWGWQTSAWSNGRWYQSAHIRQYAYTYNGGGLTSADRDRAVFDDFGQWRAFVPPGTGGSGGQTQPGGSHTGGDSDMTDEQFAAMMQELGKQSTLLHELRYTVGTNDSFRQAIQIALEAGAYDEAARLNDDAHSKNIVTGLPAGWRHAG